jgi:hypothetical protein
MPVVVQAIAAAFAEKCVATSEIRSSRNPAHPGVRYAGRYRRQLGGPAPFFGRDARLVARFEPPLPRPGRRPGRRLANRQCGRPLRGNLGPGGAAICGAEGGGGTLPLRALRSQVSRRRLLAGATAATGLALFYAWHVAATERLSGQLLLGMSAPTAAAFRRATLDSLPALVAGEAANLCARWRTCNAYWRALVRAASHADAERLRRVQLFGLQLEAAARLP